MKRQITKVIVQRHWAELKEGVSVISDRELDRLASEKMPVNLYLSEIYNHFYDLMKHDLDFYLGAPPAEFEFQGKKYTPQSFAQKILFPGASRKAEKYSFLPVVAGDASLEKMIREELDAGMPVLLTYQHAFDLTDDKTGVMSVAAFNLPFVFDDIARQILTDNHTDGHMVLIVGYDQDLETGRLIKLKIKNSWGKKAGDGGYYHMYMDYFYAFGLRVRLPNTFPDVFDGPFGAVF